MEAKHTAGPWAAKKSEAGNYTGFDIECAAPGNKRWIASVHSAHSITGDESPELAAKKAKEIAEAEANAEFIVRACNAHDDLVKALNYLLEQTVDQDLAHGILLSEGEHDARNQALAILAKVGAA